MTLQEALCAAQALPLDRLDAQLLLLHVLAATSRDEARGPASGAARGRAWLLAHDDAWLPTPAQQQFEALTARRAAGEPLAYLTGFKSFYGLEVAVTPAVLIPRPDTETLVDWALLLLSPTVARPSVLDLGTGSGAIALAIKHHHAQAVITAADDSLAALEVASGNAQRLGLNIAFLHSNWLQAVGGNGGQAAGQRPRFDLIVSNPPYIALGDTHLPALRYEPQAALTSAANGLADIQQIITQAPTHLQPGGWLLLEHGFDQAAPVRERLAQAGFAHVQSRCDLNGIERCSGGQFVG